MPSDRTASQQVCYRSTAKSVDLSDEHLGERIGDIQDEFTGYRYRRVTRELHARGHLVNHRQVARVMKARGLSIKPRSSTAGNRQCLACCEAGRSSDTLRGVGTQAQGTPADAHS